MKIVCLLGTLIFSSLSFAQEEVVKPTYMNFLYRVEQGDTFASILRMYVKDDSIINKSTPLVQKTMSFNPHISDWTQLSAGSLISIYIPEDMMDMSKYKSKQAVVITKNEEVKKLSRPRLVLLKVLKVHYFTWPHGEISHKQRKEQLLIISRIH